MDFWLKSIFFPYQRSVLFFWKNTTFFEILKKVPSLARSVQKRLKVPSLACSVQKPLNQPECRTSIARLIKPASQPVGDQPRSSQPASKLATNKRIGGQQRQGWYQPSWYLHSFLTISLQPHPLHGTRAEVRKECRYQPGSC